MALDSAVQITGGHISVEGVAAQAAAGENVGVEAGEIAVISAKLERVSALGPAQRIEELYGAVGTQAGGGSTGALITGDTDVGNGVSGRYGKASQAEFA